MKNTPYRKVYKNGVVVNPIKGHYPGREFLYMDREGNQVFNPNRRMRREKGRPFNNRKFIRSRQNRQIIFMENGHQKTIIHHQNIRATRFGK